MSIFLGIISTTAESTFGGGVKFYGPTFKIILTESVKSLVLTDSLE